MGFEGESFQPQEKELDKKFHYDKGHFRMDILEGSEIEKELMEYADSLPDTISDLQEILGKLEQEFKLKQEESTTRFFNDKRYDATREGPNQPFEKKSLESQAIIRVDAKIDMVKSKIEFLEKIEKEKAELGHRGFSA